MSKKIDQRHYVSNLEEAIFNLRRALECFRLGVDIKIGVDEETFNEVSLAIYKDPRGQPFSRYTPCDLFRPMYGVEFVPWRKEKFEEPK